MTTQTDLMAVRAARIATEAHKGQTRWDGKTPYITHPAAVAKACRDANYGVICECVAWLHDVIEDTKITAGDLLDRGIPSDVVRAVEHMSKKKGQSYLDYLKQVQQDGLAVVVKIEDIKHNMSDLKPGSMYQKYELALYILHSRSL